MNPHHHRVEVVVFDSDLPELEKAVKSFDSHTPPVVAELFASILRQAKSRSTDLSCAPQNPGDELLTEALPLSEHPLGGVLAEVLKNIPAFSQQPTHSKAASSSGLSL